LLPRCWATAGDAKFVTVWFWLLSSVREINKGDEIAWYADGDSTIRPLRMVLVSTVHLNHV